MPLEFRDLTDSSNPQELVFRDSNTKPLTEIDLIFQDCRNFSNVVIPLVFYNANSKEEVKEEANSLVFCDSNIHVSEDNLVFCDSNSTEILSYSDNLYFQTSNILVDFLGQILNLKKQNDTNQCGVCAIFNTLTILGMEHNWNVLSVRD